MNEWMNERMNEWRAEKEGKDWRERKGRTGVEHEGTHFYSSLDLRITGMSQNHPISPLAPRRGPARAREAVIVAGVVIPSSHPVSAATGY